MVSKTVVDYLERIKRLYVLIKQERTGSLNDIARKMLLSRRTITNYISELKSLGADIRYDKRVLRDKVRFFSYFQKRAVAVFLQPLLFLYPPIGSSLPVTPATMARKPSRKRSHS